MSQRQLKRHAANVTRYKSPSECREIAATLYQHAETGATWYEETPAELWRIAVEIEAQTAQRIA